MTLLNFCLCPICGEGYRPNIDLHVCKKSESADRVSGQAETRVKLPTVDLEQNRKEVIEEVVDILQTEWSSFFDDEVLSKDEFRPIDAFYKSIMDKINSRWSV
jgi:hypothetical protein